MRILLTGATGLIGKELGKRLVLAGHEVVVVSRNVDKARRELPFPARIFSWAGGRTEFPSQALSGLEAVINLAGEPIAGSRWSARQKAAITDSRVLGTQKLIEALLRNPTPLKYFVQGSAIGIYGDRADETLNEDSSAGTGFLASVVIDWEATLRPLSQSGVPVSVLRTGLVLSRHGGFLSKIAPLFALGLGGKLSSGQQWMSWIHIDDMISAIEHLLVGRHAGIFNLTAPQPARNDRFTLALAKALGRNVFFPVPSLALRMAMGEASQLALASQRVLPKRLSEVGFQFHYSELPAALEEICQPLRGGRHELLNEQWLPRLPAEIFPFFSSETNLEKITPPFLRFRVLGKTTDEIRSGTFLDYRLRVHGVPMKWRTEIIDWRPDESFIDRQVTGPYREWHHTHEFLPMAGGTLMRDRVRYQLPLGFVGETMAGWKVSRDVLEIFRYRRESIDQVFGARA